MSERKLTHQPGTARISVLAGKVLPLAEIKLGTHLYARCEVPEQIGRPIESVFVLRRGDCLGGKEAHLAHLHGSKQIGAEIILHADVPAECLRSIHLPGSIRVGDKVVVAHLEVAAGAFEAAADSGGSVSGDPGM